MFLARAFFCFTIKSETEKLKTFREINVLSLGYYTEF